MRFILGVAISAMLMVAHQSTAPPSSHNSVQNAYANAQVDIAPSPVSWSKVLNLDTFIVFVLPTMRAEVLDSDSVFGTMPKEAVPERGAGFGSTMMSTNIAMPYLSQGEACADKRATFEDC
jgi:hypothetical protein